jgi:hypothetical protein
MKRVTIILAAMAIVFATAVLPTVRAVAQSSIVTTDNLNEKIASATTAADHEAIAAFYKEQAAESEKNAKLHLQSAETYRKLKISKPVYMASMCDGIAKMWKKIAADDRALAKAHEAMARAAEK